MSVPDMLSPLLSGHRSAATPVATCSEDYLVPNSAGYDDGVEESSSPAGSVRLTARGARTRSRIVGTAADLMRVRGVGATTLDDVVLASTVSKSQLYRHFPDKPALVRAVIEWSGERTITGERERLETVRTITGLRRWRDALIQHNALHDGRYGCPLGSLANQVSDHDEVARRQLEELFRAWRVLFAGVFHRLRSEGVLPQDSDVDQLATGFVAAVQGGYLLAQTARDVAPMATAIDLVIDHVQLLSDNASAT